MFLLKTCNIKGMCWQCKPAMSCCAETEKTPSNKEHHLPSASPTTLLQPILCTKLPFIPPCVPALNVSRITESPSHMKSQTVNRHSAYLSGKTTVTEFCWVLLIKHAFCQCAMLKAIKSNSDFSSQIVCDLISDWLFWSLTHQKWLIVK